MIFQTVSAIGAGCILITYVTYQFGIITKEQFIYNILNMIGSAILLVVAYIQWNVGFFILNVVWFIVSVLPTYKSMSR